MSPDEEILKHLDPGKPECDASGCGESVVSVLQALDCKCVLLFCAKHRVWVAALILSRGMRCSKHDIDVVAAEWSDL